MTYIVNNQQSGNIKTVVSDLIFFFLKASWIILGKSNLKRQEETSGEVGHDAKKDRCALEEGTGSRIINCGQS